MQSRNIAELDLAIVGGGLAAAAAAAMAARQGLRLVLLRRGATPDFGEVMDAQGLAVLEQTGLLGVASVALGEAVGGLRLRWPPAQELLQVLPGAGHIVEPARLTDALLDSARLAGAVILDCAAPESVLSRASADEPWLLQTPQQAVGIPVTQVIDASGQGVWASAYGLRRTTLYSHAAVHVRGHCLGTTGCGHSSMLVSARPQGWLYRLAFPGPQVAGAIFLRQMPMLQRQVQLLAAELMRSERGLPYSALRARVLRCPLAFAQACHGPGWMAIGAAALSLDPLSGHGMSWALESARHAVQICLQREQRLAGLRAYEDFWLAAVHQAYQSALRHYGEAAKAFGTAFWKEASQALQQARLPQAASGWF